MKITTILLFAFLQLPLAFSAVIEKRAVVRDEHFQAHIKDVILTDLISDSSYEGVHFKIVQGKNEKAIGFDESEELQLKAATTYYHLTKAREYFASVVLSKHVQDLPQLIIRIDLINVFNEVGHFANDNLDPQFNNALTIPAGAGYEPKNIKPWNTEIWFRPSKEIHVRDFKGPVDFGSAKGSLISFRNQTHMVNLERFVTSVLQGGVTSESSSLGSVMRLVGSSLIVEAIYQTTDIAAEFFSRKIYRLDAALVPEIIYHEFAHVALSNYLELSHSTPVNEGLADFFAGKIAKSKKLATKIKDYNLFNGKEVRKKQQYRLSFERGDYANADFVFGLLWTIGEIVGEKNEARFMDTLTKKINTSVSIKDGLLEATLETCKEVCLDQWSTRLRLYKLFDSKNM